MEQKLDTYEKDIEGEISQFTPAGDQKRELVEGIIDNASVKKSISLRLKANDLELLKRAQILKVYRTRLYYQVLSTNLSPINWLIKEVS